MTKPAVIPELVVGQRPQRERPSSGRSEVRPSLSLIRVVRRTSTWTPYLPQLLLVLGGELEILGVARGDDDLALVVELLRVVDNCERAHDPRPGGKHRHRARLGDILSPWRPLRSSRRCAGPGPDAQKYREPPPMSPQPDGGAVAERQASPIHARFGACAPIRRTRCSGLRHGAGQRRLEARARGHAPSPHLELGALEVLADRLGAAAQVRGEERLGDGVERDAVLRHGKAVPLLGVQHVGDGQALGPHGRDDLVGLRPA